MSPRPGRRMRTSVRASVFPTPRCYPGVRSQAVQTCSHVLFITFVQGKQCHIYFTHENSDTRRGHVTCPRLHVKYTAEAGTEPRTAGWMHGLQKVRARRKLELIFFDPFFFQIRRLRPEVRQAMLCVSRPWESHCLSLGFSFSLVDFPPLC